MNTKNLWPRPSFLAMTFATLIGAALLIPTQLNAQVFDVGSDGSLGDVVITNNTTMNLPANGKLNFRSLTVNSGATLQFNPNTNNTPVFVLAQTEIVVNGTIDVSGGSRIANAGGAGGPGGFAGGNPGFGPEVPPGDGHGPGGGAAGSGTCNVPDPNSAQGGSYGTAGLSAPGTNIYGNTLLLPLVGGSGGGGSDGANSGGGGGGGAILLAANSRVAVNGAILARGGFGGVCNNPGSGGAIRLLGFKVEGAGQLLTEGGNTPNRGFSNPQGIGRVRIDTVIRTGLNFSINAVSTIGGNLLVFPPTVPTLNVTQAAGNAVPLGSAPVVFTLAFGSDTNQTIRIQAQDFNRNVPIRVTLTPDSGPNRIFDASIDNTTINPAVIDVPVTVPINTLVTVHCWTR